MTNYDFNDRTEEPIENDWIDGARILGERYGKAMAEQHGTDRFDGVWVPNLSGEWADDPTPTSLYRYLGVPDSYDNDGVLDAICEAWETAALKAYHKR